MPGIIHTDVLYILRVVKILIKGLLNIKMYFYAEKN